MSFATMLRDALTFEDSFAAAQLSLRRQPMARGLDGRLAGVQCHMHSDGRTAVLYSHYDVFENPPCAAFRLPRQYSDDEFDPGQYVARCEA
jgi:hypothetical protein